MFEKQINIIKAFNIYDVIARIGGLCLEPRNQNTSFMLDEFVDELTEKDFSFYQGTAIISDGKFKKVIQSISQINELKMQMDPLENLFAENVMFYGNYMVFNSIDNEPAYQLQMMLDSFCLHAGEYPKEFNEEIYKLVRTILSISDSAYRGISNKSFEIDNGKDIYLPAGSDIKRNSGFIVLSGIKVRNLLGDENLFWSMLLDFGHKHSENDQNKQIFSHPFIYDDVTDSLILVDVGLLAQFLIYSCISLAEKAGIKKQFVRNFNDEAYANVCASFNLLGHNIINSEKILGIKSLKTDSYQDAFFTAGSGRAIYLSLLSDECGTYNSDTIHSVESLDISDEKVIDQYRLIQKRLKTIGNENIYHVICFNSIGRTISYLDSKEKEISKYDPIRLTPHELWCVAVNESGTANFLPRYIRAKELLNKDRFPSVFSELNEIALYKSNHLSFYITDDFPIDSFYMINEPGDSLEYIKEAYNKVNLHLIYGPTSDCLIKIIQVDPARSIYSSDVLDNHVVQFIKTNDVISMNGGIWVIGDSINNDPDRIEPIHTSFTFLSYWLGECRNCFGNLESLKYPINIFVKVIDDPSDYFQLNEENQYKEPSELLNISHSVTDGRSSYEIIWTAALNNYLIWENNEHEKRLIKYLIKYILSAEKLPLNVDETIGKAFSDPLKRKINFANINFNPCNKPITLSDSWKIHTINKQDEEYIQDVVGPSLVNSGVWKIGLLSGEQRSIALNNAVKYLYEKLTSIVNTLDPDGLVEHIYYDIEAAVYNSVFISNSFANEIRCYPEKEKQILESYNNESKTLSSAKFLIEYVAAGPPKGTKKIDTLTYEYLLAICSSILEYAYLSDASKYEIYTNDIEILKSGRLGLDHESLELLTSRITDHRKEEMDFYSSHNVESIYSSWNHKEKLTNAFNDEFGYSYEDFINVVLALISIGKNQNNEIHIFKKKELLNELNNNLKKKLGIPSEVIGKIINDLSLSERNDFLIPPTGYKKSEVWPWRFNRRYSFTRRPIITRNDELIWGNRSLYRMLQFVFMSVQDGTIPVKSDQFKDLLGIIGNERGKHFNTIVADTIEAMKLFDIYRNIKEVNGIRIADTKGQTLGDIDVLVIDKANQVIIPIEVKSFKQARNPYEIKREHMELFEDTCNKTCYVTKHRRRVEWCENHIHDFICQYKLSNAENWKIKGLFVVNYPQFSKEAYHENILILTRAELTVSNLLRVENANR